MARFPKVNPALVEKVSGLVKALNTLEAEQGERARRNARARVATQIRQLRAAVDEAFPAPARKGSKGPRKTPEQVVAGLKREGWVDAIGVRDLVIQIAAAGIRPYRRNWWTIDKTGISSRAKVRTSAVLVPGWALTIAKHAPGKLNAAAHDVKVRKAVLTELALSLPPGTQQFAARQQVNQTALAMTAGAATKEAKRLLRKRLA